jgi:hypothetical protein
MAPPRAGFRCSVRWSDFRANTGPARSNRFGEMLVSGGQCSRASRRFTVTLRRPILEGATSTVCCKLRSLMGFQERGGETCGGARLTTRRQGRQGRLVSKNKDFTREIGGRRGTVAKKKLEFIGNPGYPLFHIKKPDELGPRAWGCCGLVSVSPVRSYGLPVLPTQDGATPE